MNGIIGLMPKVNFDKIFRNDQASFTVFFGGHNIRFMCFCGW
jgi:hypothetical protein